MALSPRQLEPAIFVAPDWVANGGLMLFEPDFADATRHLIAQVDRVLKGAKPNPAMQRAPAAPRVDM
jgi:hypothetical protein